MELYNYNIYLDELLQKSDELLQNHKKIYKSDKINNNYMAFRKRLKKSEVIQMKTAYFKKIVKKSLDVLGDNETSKLCPFILYQPRVGIRKSQKEKVQKKED